MKFIRVAALAALSAVSPTTLAAQAGGPYAPYVLMLPVGARTLAMGNTGVVSRDDDVLFFNPAQLMVARGTSGSIERYSSSSAGGTLSSVTRLTSSALALGMRVVTYDEPLSFTGTGAPTPIIFPFTRNLTRGSPQRPGTSLEASLGYANTLKGVRWGVATNYVEDEVPGLQISRVVFDAGAAKDLFRYYTIGLSVQNIGKGFLTPCDGMSAPRAGECAAGSPIGTVHLPLRTTLGGSFAHQLGEFDFASTAAVSMLRRNFVVPSGGAELSYSWIDGYNVAFRAGVRRPLPGESAVTGGVGFTADRLSLDYAIETLADSRVGHRVGFRIR